MAPERSHLSLRALTIGTKSAAGSPGDPDDENNNKKPDYKRPNDKLEKGDQVDLDRFSKQVKVDGQPRARL